MLGEEALDLRERGRDDACFGADRDEDDGRVVVALAQVVEGLGGCEADFGRGELGRSV